MEKILVVVDMQRDFVDGSLGTKEELPELALPLFSAPVCGGEGPHDGLLRNPVLFAPRSPVALCELQYSFMLFQFRQLWIARINAAARMNGLSYSRFMYGLKLAEVEINRKMLAEMAVNDADGFKTLAELAKSKLACCRSPPPASWSRMSLFRWCDNFSPTGRTSLSRSGATPRCP